MKKTALVLGAGGFIGSHIARRLVNDGYWVRGADIKRPEFSETACHEFIVSDLRHAMNVERIMNDLSFDEVYQLSADMGGAQYIFSGENDANVMHNSALINLNVAHYAVKTHVGKLFYSSSACIYPQQIQDTPDNKGLKESDAYPINPDSEYGYEKIFSERLYSAHNRNFELDIRIARFHNIFGQEGTYKGGKEKAPAAMIRKVCEANDGGSIEVMGDGQQTRSFLHISECVEGVMRLMKSSYINPVNIGSDEMVSINQLAQMCIDISGKKLSIKNVPSNSIGVRGRNSNNDLISEVLNWKPSRSLNEGLIETYNWVNLQVNKK